MKMKSYAPGTPSWVDVTGPDVAALASFYCSLFGWESQDMGEEAGHYTMFSLDGASVAAASPPMAGSGAPPAWTTYITVADADATAAVIAEAGGTVVMPPMDVMQAGRMAMAADPSGGMFAMWQPGDHIGAELVNVPGTLCWNELTVRNADSVLEFYTAVFGWKVVTTGGEGAPFTYRELHLGDRPIGGCMEMDQSWPPEIPTHWMAYFAVADTDESAARAAQLGATVSVEPFDLPVGRASVLNDPNGAVFSILALTEATS